MPGIIMADLGGLGYAVLYVLVGGLVGLLLVMLASAILPRILGRLTPNIDEEKEIARGNQAVAEYFGRIVSAGMIGVSIVMAAAVLGGIVSALL